MLASEIKTPSTWTLSRKHDTCGDTNRPVLKPPSWRDRAILRATDPCVRRDRPSGGKAGDRVRTSMATKVRNTDK